MLSPELATELRSARPSASPVLRERVLAVAAQEEPRRPPRFTLPPLRRLAVVAVPAALALAIGGAVVHGLVHSGRSGREVAGTKEVHSGSAGQLNQPGAGELAPISPRVRGIVPSTPTRLQRYTASLRVQVKNLNALSDA